MAALGLLVAALALITAGRASAHSPHLWTPADEAETVALGWENFPPELVARGLAGDLEPDPSGASNLHPFKSRLPSHDGIPVAFRSSSDAGYATLGGFLFVPDEHETGRLPGIVFGAGDGVEQERYLWAARGLAEAGYLVLTFDYAGIGRSADAPRPSNESRNTQFRDAIDFMHSTPGAPYDSGSANPYNPLHGMLDRERVGTAGHSRGGYAAQRAGDRGGKVKAIVSLDEGWGVVMREYKGSAPLQAQAGDFDCGPWGNIVANRCDPALREPADRALARVAENPVPVATRDLDPDRRLTNPEWTRARFPEMTNYREVVARGVEAQVVVIQGASHRSWWDETACCPKPMFALEMSLFYMMAWFDKYLRDDAGNGTPPMSATRRLTTVWQDAARGDHRDGRGYGMSRKYHSAYSIRSSDGETLLRCDDMLDDTLTGPGGATIPCTRPRPTAVARSG